MWRSTVGAVLAAMCAVQASSAQQIEAGSVRVRFTGRAQVQFSTSSVSDEEADAVVANTTFETRRVRLAAQLTIDDWITGVVEPDFAGGTVQLRNAYMELGFSDALALRVGQFKKPFSRLQLESSTTYPAIERAVRIRGLDDALEFADKQADEPVLSSFANETLLGEEQALLDALGYDGYELGATLGGDLGSVSYTVGVFNGSGANARDNNDGKSAAARLVWSAGESMPLELGGAVSYREVGEPKIDGTAFEADFEWGGFRRPGLHVLGEVATGSIIANDASFLGVQVLASAFQPLEGERLEGWEVVGRVSWGDANDTADEDAGLLLTPGLTLYMLGRNRLMFNWDVYMPSGDRFETQHAFRAQAQLHF